MDCFGLVWFGQQAGAWSLFQGHQLEPGAQPAGLEYAHIQYTAQESGWGFRKRDRAGRRLIPAALLSQVDVKVPYYCSKKGGFRGVYSLMFTCYQDRPPGIKRKPRLWGRGSYG